MNCLILFVHFLFSVTSNGWNKNAWYYFSLNQCWKNDFGNILDSNRWKDLYVKCHVDTNCIIYFRMFETAYCEMQQLCKKHLHWKDQLVSNFLSKINYELGNGSVRSFQGHKTVLKICANSYFKLKFCCFIFNKNSCKPHCLKFLVSSFIITVNYLTLDSYKNL